MQRLACALSLAILVLFVSAALSGCQMIRKKSGWTSTVSEPDAGTPEAVVHKVMEAAMLDDYDKSWKKLKRLFHHKIKSSAGDLRNWESLYWKKGSRKKIRKGLYFDDDDEVVWQFAYMEGEGTKTQPLQLFVYNEGNPDYPTPCTLARDSKANDEWRIAGQCL